MKILLCHNFYQLAGGEDHSFAAEASLLESYEHQVIRFTRHNDSFNQMNQAQAARRIFWNKEVYESLIEIMRRESPDVMHCTNIFPLLSSSVYTAAQAEGVPIVQSLRNYRYSCLNSYFLRNNRKLSFIIATISMINRIMITWKDAIDCYFTPSEFSRSKLIECGLAPELVKVKPNFVFPDPTPGGGNGGYALFVGRLSAEKGIQTLLDAWQNYPPPLPLKIIGDEPLSGMVKKAADTQKNIEWLGPQSHDDVLSCIGEAAMLIMPSIWYETFGRTIVESYAKGIPVIATRLGAMENILVDGETGLFLEPGDSKDLAQKVKQLVDNPTLRNRMQVAARTEYETQYTAQQNHTILINIYNRAILNHSKKTRRNKRTF